MKTLLATFSTIALVASASVATAEVSRQSYQYRGEAASAQFSSSDDCSYTGAYIWGAEEATRSTAARPVYATHAYGSVYSYNWCTGEQFQGFGQTTTGVTINTTTSATLSVPMNFFSSSCSEVDGEYVCVQTPLGSSTFTVQLTGTGDVFRGHSVSTWHGGQTHSTSRYNGTYRDATVTGVLQFNGLQLASGQSWAQLNSSTSGSHTISRQ